MKNWKHLGNTMNNYYLSSAIYQLSSNNVQCFSTMFQISK